MQILHIHYAEQVHALPKQALRAAVPQVERTARAVAPVWACARADLKTCCKVDDTASVGIDTLMKTKWGIESDLPLACGIIISCTAPVPAEKSYSTWMRFSVSTSGRASLNERSSSALVLI
jgi:hypothetical protein